MTKINERKFINQFTGGDAGIDINQLSEETKKVLEGAGVDLSQVDSNNDGIIKGKKELSLLFKVVDGFDSATDRKIETTYDKNMATVGGLVNDALVEEFNRNAAKARMTGPKHNGTAGEKTADATKSEPEWLANPSFDQPFFEKLANLPDAELKRWYNAHPENHVSLQEWYGLLGTDKMSPTVVTKLQKLGTQLQKLEDEKVKASDEREAAAPLDHYRNRSQDAIAKEYVERIQKAVARRGADARPAEIESIVSDLRLLQQTDKSNGKTYSNAMAAFKQALAFKEGYSNGIKTRTIPMSDAVEAAAALQGPGSSVVKADLIEAMVQQRRKQQKEKLGEAFPKGMVNIMLNHPGFGSKTLKELEKYQEYAGQAQMALLMMKTVDDEPYPGQYIATLMKSDPAGLAREFEFNAEKNPTAKIVLDDAFDAVYRAYRNEPNKAADIVGGMLGSVASDLADVSRERPMDNDKLESTSVRAGFMLSSAKSMMQTMANDEKKAIDEGAFIGNIFAKAVSSLSGIDGFETNFNEVVASQKDKEYAAVDEWQKGIESKFRNLMDAVFLTAEPAATDSSDAMKDYRTALQKYHVFMDSGIQEHRSLEERQD